MQTPSRCPPVFFLWRIHPGPYPSHWSSLQSFTFVAAGHSCGTSQQNKISINNDFKLHVSYLSISEITRKEFMKSVFS
jgi:hypothetical protein